jgi:hypothetical protein
MMSKVFKIYAAVILGWLAHAQLFGWTWTSVDEVKQVPKSVRDNPGSYRSHYSSYRPFRWGK